MNYPVMENEFESVVLEWIMQDGKGREALTNLNVGIIDYKLKIIKSGFTTNIAMHMRYDLKLEYYNNLEQYMNNVSQNAPIGLKVNF